MDDSVPVLAGVVGWWTDLDSGWQAVVLGGVLVAIVQAGVSIPW